MLTAAAVILCLLAIAHSALGERFIISRLLRRNDLPKIFGSASFTAQTLRYCWHLTSVMGFGIAYLLIQIGHGDPAAALVRTLAVTMFLSAALAIVVTRGRHLSWVGFIMAGVICIRHVGV
jgi:hypothetical protein